MDIDKIYRSGRVLRWHSYPEIECQTNAQHQWGVAVIIMANHPNPSAELLKAALLHDAGEIVVGDMPKPCKDKKPELLAEYEKAEALALDGMGIKLNLTKKEQAWLEWAGRAEAYRWMVANNHALRHKPEWKYAALWIEENKP